MQIFLELSLIVAVTTVCAAVARMFRQPLIVGYILAGVLVGPQVFNFLTSTDFVDFFSKLGIAILLFIIGLNLNPDSLREVGKASVFIGIGQVIVTSIVGYTIAVIMGFSTIHSLYISIALTFSSTIIILKLLSDKGDLNKLYGRITVGILLIQDLVATIIILFIPFFSNTNEGSSITISVLTLLLKGAIMTVAIYLLSRKVIPRISENLASNQEMLFLFSLAWGLGFAALFEIIGFSLAIGALVAGVALSVSPFAYEIASRLKPLRDFFVTIFFVLLGSQIVFVDMSGIFLKAILLSVFVLVGNPLIVFFIMNLLGFKRRSAFETGLTMAQISEFSLILIALAFKAGHVSQEIVSLVTLVGVITISGSTYLIMYSGKIFHRLDPLLKKLEIRRKNHHEPHILKSEYDMIIFGYDRVGGDFVEAARRIGAKYLVVDYNPESIKKLQIAEIPFHYGDASDTEFLQDINFASAKLVVSTVPDYETNLLLVKTYIKANPSGIIIVLSHSIPHANNLYLAGASYVVMPHHLGAHHASLMIERYRFNHEEFDRERNIHLSKLAKKNGQLKQVRKVI